MLKMFKMKTGHCQVQNESKSKNSPGRQKLIWKKFRIRLNLFRINLFRITVNFFLTDTCIGIIKSSGVRKFFPNSKFLDKGISQVRLYNNCLKNNYFSIINYITNLFKTKTNKTRKIKCRYQLNEFIKHNDVN